MYSTLQQITVMVVPVLGAVTFHELAHGWVADRLGDPTPRLSGRLTINPLKHLDLVGTLVFFLTRMIGWAKPVPINPLHFRDPRKGMVWVALAGPSANLLLATGCAFLFRALASLPISASSFLAKVFVPLLLMLKIGVVINLGLAFFNIIPVPPLDGGRVLVGILPREKALSVARVEPYGFLILILLIVAGVVEVVIYPLIRLGVRILLGGLW
ncbi:MAG: site-2 protease family protein [Deltaproteobacteria bacterium]|nr:MAG: site-2 protease family protein [Deltaproteobacteria bacterium]RLA97050.1 MAG: site-2 protease family protein [Deltaproteobacteria bacterium]